MDIREVTITRASSHPDAGAADAVHLSAAAGGTRGLGVVLTERRGSEVRRVSITIEDIADLLRLRYVLDGAITTLQGEGDREAEGEPDEVPGDSAPDAGGVLVEGAGNDYETVVWSDSGHPGGEHAGQPSPDAGDVPGPVESEKKPRTACKPFGQHA